jgi:hypothetical protein
MDEVVKLVLKVTPLDLPSREEAQLLRSSKWKPLQQFR